MTCDQVRSRLSWLLDGELDPTEGSAVRAHAAECGKCDALLSEMSANDQEIRSALADHHQQSPLRRQRLASSPADGT